jgi:hypothetical protein
MTAGRQMEERGLEESSQSGLKPWADLQPQRVQDPLRCPDHSSPASAGNDLIEDWPGTRASRQHWHRSQVSFFRECHTMPERTF